METLETLANIVLRTEWSVERMLILALGSFGLGVLFTLWLRPSVSTVEDNGPSNRPLGNGVPDQLAAFDWELQATRQFLQAPTMGQRLQVVMTALQSDSTEGFVALFRFVHNVPRLAASQGLDAESQRRLHLSPELIRATTSAGFFAISESDLPRSRAITGLTNGDRTKLQSPCTFRLGDINRPWGVVVCSRQPTVEWADSPEPIELDPRMLGRWTTLLGGELARLESVDRQGNELALTQEMLELRALTDLQYRSPSHMLQKYLSRMSEMASFERGALFLFEQDQDAHPLPLVRSGVPLPRELAALWEQGEEALSRETAGSSSASHWNGASMQRLGVEGPFALAILMPLIHGQWVMGQVCLTRRTAEPLEEDDLRLIRWGTEYLVELLTRTVDRVTMEQHATRDGLTQLVNRRTFDLELDRVVDQANRTGGECALLLLDLDHFKKVNDTYGHLAGDAALRTAAHVVERSVQAMRDDDNPVVARYGGEELVVLLPGVGEPGARRIAESIREAVERTPITFESGTFHITLSAGVAVRSPEPITARAFIATADDALYRAKGAGRNRVELDIARNRGSSPSPVVSTEARTPDSAGRSEG